MKKLFVAAICAFALWGQNSGSSFRYSSTSGNVSLSGSGYSFTIQQPNSGAKQITLEAAVVYCSVACSVTQSQNGTAATATAGTINPLLPFGPASSATIWTASNVGGGVAAGGSLALQAGIPQSLDMSKIVLPKQNSATNYTFVFSSITGTANVTLYWSETP